LPNSQWDHNASANIKHQIQLDDIKIVPHPSSGWPEVIMSFDEYSGNGLPVDAPMPSVSGSHSSLDQSTGAVQE